MMLKRLIKKVVPQSLLRKSVSFATPAILRIKAGRIRRVFDQSGETPEWLDNKMLEALAYRYPVTAMQSYDSDSLEHRGQTKAKELISLTQAEAEKIETFLEIGCYDGMVCGQLQKQGKHCTGIDIHPGNFDERAIAVGAQLFEMNATELRFPDASFDFVYSYDAFEHIANPEKAFCEATRVVRRGGYIYLNFGPLYYSPLGAHLMASINMPYCHLLFPQAEIASYIKRKGLPQVDFDSVNKLSLNDFRSIWKQNTGSLKKIIYEENRNCWSLDMIDAYPSCFKSKTDDFDNLLISDIRVLFKKLN